MRLKAQLHDFFKAMGLKRPPKGGSSCFTKREK